MELYKSGKKSPVELVEMIKQYTGEGNLSSITDIGKALMLMEALKA
jgi:formiminotetrahydrofolate cyclodeaminase